MLSRLWPEGCFLAAEASGDGWCGSVLLLVMLAAALVLML